MSERMRLDALLVERGYFDTADAALRAILAGDVSIEENVCSFAGQQVACDVEVRVVKKTAFVSRGGDKLEGAFDAFKLDVQGLSCLDCGASTGGFTDCLLQHGAARVCSVDVGYGDFAWSLRRDARVSLFERCNIRKVSPDTLGAPFDLAVADVSFAPLRSYIVHIAAMLGEGGAAVVLVKPQFEASKSEVGERGVVHDVGVHVKVLQRAIESFEACGLAPLGLCMSPLEGRKGNKEFLLYGRKGVAKADIDVQAIARGAHA